MNGRCHDDRMRPNRLARRDFASQRAHAGLSVGTAPAIQADGLWRLRRTLVQWLLRRGVVRDEAEDAIQDAFLRLYLAERRQRVRNTAAFLTGIVKRIRIELWHAAQRRRQKFVAERIENLGLTDTAPQPPDYIQADQRLERMWRRLEELNTRTRDVFLQHRLEGWTCREIAAALGISISAVEKHIARAAFALADENQDG